MPVRLTVRSCICLLPMLLAGTVANAQLAGDVLWKLDINGFAYMSQPRVAPDGTIYLHTNNLYAISPAGVVLWSKPLAVTAYVDIGPDGTVYAGSANTIYAYAADGSLKWSFTESPAGQGLMAGPTVGPDGNIYAISDLAGLGAFSLTPLGQLRWSVPGFGDNAGTGQGRVQFGPDRLYFAEDWNPSFGGCQTLAEGMSAVTLSGQLDWCLPISGVARPTATLDGRSLTYQSGLSGKTLTAYNTDSSASWTYTFGFSPTGINSVGVGPDGNVYVWHGISTLASLTPAGSLRWARSQSIVNFPWRATVAQDVQALVSGSGYGFGVNGEILAADPSSGSLLWKIPVTGPSAGAGAPAEFSPDGQTVYVPVNTVSFADPDQLWAIRVHGTSQVPVAPSSLAALAQSKVVGGQTRVRVRLTWKDNSTNETGFGLERCLGSGCSNFAPVSTLAANSVSYFDQAVAGGKTYRYRVLATGLAGSSPYSNIVSVTTP